jgi:hypothetical protein
MWAYEAHPPSVRQIDRFVECLGGPSIGRTSLKQARHASVDHTPRVAQGPYARLEDGPGWISCQPTGREGRIASPSPSHASRSDAS